MLVDRGFSLNTVNDTLYTPLHLAVCGGHLEVAQWLYSRGCSLSARTRDGDTPLLLACYCGHIALVEWILSKVPDARAALRSRNSGGLTALLSAANGGRTDVVQHLLLLGCDLEEPTEDGFTPLLLAACRDHLDTFQALLLQGASLLACTHANTLITDLAGDTVALWLPAVMHASPLHLAALFRNTAAAHRMLRLGENPQALVLIAHHAMTALEVASTSFELPGALRVDSALVALLARASRPWSPYTHFLFGPRFRANIKLYLLYFQRLLHSSPLPQLPEEIVWHILSFLPRNDEPWGRRVVRRKRRVAPHSSTLAGNSLGKSSSVSLALATAHHAAGEADDVTQSAASTATSSVASSVASAASVGLTALAPTIIIPLVASPEAELAALVNQFSV